MKLFKLWTTIIKDIRVILTDKVGLIFMFVMPILLAIVITAIQNSTFELVNNKKIILLLSNRDTCLFSHNLVEAIEKSGMFDIISMDSKISENELVERMHQKDALLSLVIPVSFSKEAELRAMHIASKTLVKLGLNSGTSPSSLINQSRLTIYFHPVLQESFRTSVNKVIYGSFQVLLSKEVFKKLNFILNGTELTDKFETDLFSSEVPINEIPVSRNGSRTIPNATQHNIPAWTIFAMFFVVISLGSSIVREKLNGSFVRLKTLPTSIFVALLSKQVTYLFITLLQTLVIFSIGFWLFPYINLPKLIIPSNFFGLIVISLISGWCAVSFALVVGIFSQSQEQSNGIGAASIVILAAIGGLLVPSFAMPTSFQYIIKLSPMHWCLESYYGLFLEGGKLRDVILGVLPIIIITLIFQLIAYLGLKTKKLI